MLRPYLLDAVRRLGLSHPLDLARYRWHRCRMRGANAAFRREHPDFALPPDYLLYESFRIDYGAYYRTGRAGAEWVAEHFQPHLSTPTPRLLDWGCGPGRILRHLPAVFGEGGDYHGADPNARSVAWCREQLAGVSVHQSQHAPPLPFPNEHFDGLYGISIFTHLSGPAHAAWFAELMRVLRPGGLALLTTHGPAYRVKLTAAERDRFEAGEWVIRGKATEGHRVFTAYHPPDRFRRLAQRQAAVLSYQAGRPVTWGIEQDVWLLRKK